MTKRQTLKQLKRDELVAAVERLLMHRFFLLVQVLLTFCIAESALAQPTVPGPTEVDCVWIDGNECWVRTSFTASVEPSTAPSGIAGYRVCRSHDSTGGHAGCNVDMVPAGSAGSSYLVEGDDLPANGMRRAYYFRAVDNLGNWGSWNDPRYVRIDRYRPSVAIYAPAITLACRNHGAGNIESTVSTGSWV